jgi:pantoate--beta-alanine ligase
MNTVRTVAELRSELAPERRAGRTIGLVPTMGAFHEGHLSLIRRAREQCDVVVVSLFVNPAQFNEAADLARYPRDEARDSRLAAALGVDFLFAPSTEEIYPDGFSTTVTVAGLTDRLEGAKRGRAHFDGVATVVAKLFNIVGPDRAYFGQKDAQQVAVIARMARDLNLPVQIVVGATVRERDGLAMSSRNERLSCAERDRATALYRALRAAEESVAAGERDAAAVLAAAGAELLTVDAEYFELVDPDTFEPIRGRIDGDVLAVVAARVGGADGTRLIDNHTISVPSTAELVGSADPEEALQCSARC